MKFNEFSNMKNRVDTDKAFGFQCMDLYNFYCKNVLELDGNTGANCAKNILKNTYVMSNVQRIDNYATFVPQKGDIAIWTGGQYGHVAICLGEGDTNTFKTIDQNWKAQQLTHETHDYIYLSPIVFLRPKNQKNLVDEYVVRVDKTKAMVRSEATSQSNLAGSQSLVKGDTFVAVAEVQGENVNGNNIWYKSAKGNYVWSGGLTKI